MYPIKISNSLTFLMDWYAKFWYTTHSQSCNSASLKSHTQYIKYCHFFDDNGVSKYNKMFLFNYLPISFHTACSLGIVYIHNHFTSAEWTSPRRYGRASHHSLTVSSSCWLAGMPEDTRQPDIDTGRYAHTDIYFGRCRLHGGLLVVSSVLLFINLSNTIKDCQQEWQKEKEREEREEREIAFSFFTDMTLFKQLHLKLNFLFLSDNIVSGLLSLLKCPPAFYTHTHRCITYTHVDVRKSSNKSMSALGSIHSTLSAHHIVCL